MMLDYSGIIFLCHLFTFANINLILNINPKMFLHLFSDDKLNKYVKPITLQVKGKASY